MSSNEHDCKQVDKITATATKLEVVYKEVMGNGKEGLAKTAIRLQDSVETLIDVVDSFKTAISGFNKFQIEIESEIRNSEKRKANGRWLVGTIIGLGGFIIALLGYIMTR